MQNLFNQLLNGSEKPSHKKIVKWIWYGTFAAILGTIITFIGLSFTDLPSVEQLENPKSELASQVFATNGEVIGRYYTENRVPVDFEQLSPNLVNALIATEDERFYDHCGIDFKAFARAVVKTGLMGQKNSGGASTITQQLAKLLFTGPKATSFTKRVFQKLKEWIIAVRLERRYTKEEIIQMYLNKFNFINGAYGIKAASEIYFGKAQDSLNINEAAMLVGMLKNPSLYNPLRRAERVKKRRSVVLKQMQRNKMITQTAYDSLKELPLGLNFQRQTHIDGIAPYFRMEVAKDVKNLLEKEEYRKTDGSKYDIYRDGLKIYTTIDPIMQQIAEEEMVKHMQKVQKSFWRTWRKLDPWKYKTSSKHEAPLHIREQGLKHLIRNSDRYQDLRQKYLGDVLSSLSKEIDGMNFSEDDREIERIMQEYKKGGVISNLVSRRMISSSRAAKYRSVLKSDHFPKLKTQWETLQEAVKDVFNQPVDMKVFAYNKKMETDTVLSPLDSIKYHRMFLQTGILVVSPLDGKVKAWVGGINHKYFQYDHIRADRQVGSTFKPFVYATAIDKQGFSPCYQVYDLPVTIAPGDGQFHLQQEWTPKNSNGQYTGALLTLREGLLKSKNTVSAHLMKQLGDTDPIIDLLDRMGIDKTEKYSNGQFRVPRVPSICLGSTDLTVLEMTGAYTTFANNGVFVKPVYIERIEDKNGRTIYQAIPDERAAINPNANFVMVDMLRYAATGMGVLKSQVGGKTGTTNDYVDGWFMGISPNLVVGTWVGGEDRWIRFRSIDYGQGAYMAKPFFREFMKRLEKVTDIDYDINAKFYRPPGDIGIEMNCDEYLKDDLKLEDDAFEDEFSEDQFGDGNF